VLKRRNRPNPATLSSTTGIAYLAQAMLKQLFAGAIANLLRP
jgi:hypothetical protein